jgi:hypothetical protein
MINLPNNKFKTIRAHKLAVAGIFVLLILLVIIILAIVGILDCEYTHIREGVKRTCDCQGLEIAVKSSTNSGERKTICVGRITSKKTFR